MKLANLLTEAVTARYVFNITTESNKYNLRVFLKDNKNVSTHLTRDGDGLGLDMHSIINHNEREHQMSANDRMQREVSKAFVGGEIPSADQVLSYINPLFSSLVVGVTIDRTASTH